MKCTTKELEKYIEELEEKYHFVEHYGLPGGLWEENKIAIYDNYIYDDRHGYIPCRHAKLIEQVEVTWGSGATAQLSIYVIPCVVQAFNEGGYNSTGVCYDCITEEVARIHVSDM